MAILTKKQILQIPICELIECKALYYEAIKANEYYNSFDEYGNFKNGDNSKNE